MKLCVHSITACIKNDLIFSKRENLFYVTQASQYESSVTQGFNKSIIFQLKYFATYNLPEKAMANKIFEIHEFKTSRMTLFLCIKANFTATPYSR